MMTCNGSGNSATPQIESNHLEAFPEIGTLEKCKKLLQHCGIVEF